MNLGEDTFQASHQPTLHVTRPTSCLGKITLSIGNLLCTGVQLTLCLCPIIVCCHHLDIEEGFDLFPFDS